jgi:hypothetical protein
MAMKIMVNSKTAANKTIRLANNIRHVSRHSSMAYPWIDHHVQHIDEKVDDDVDAGYRQQCALNDRVVSAQDSTDNQIAKAW